MTGVHPFIWSCPLTSYIHVHTLNRTVYTSRGIPKNELKINLLSTYEKNANWGLSFKKLKESTHKRRHFWAPVGWSVVLSVGKRSPLNVFDPFSSKLPKVGVPRE